MPWTETHRSIMGDLYRIMQKFVDVPSPNEENDAYWTLLATTLNEFAVKWGINHLTINAASFVCSWLQDVYKEKRDAAERIEQAASQYRKWADDGVVDWSEQQGKPSFNDFNSTLHENDPKQAFTTQSWNKSTLNTANGSETSKYTENITKQEKEAKTNIERIDFDPRIHNGMLSFL